MKLLDDLRIAGKFSVDAYTLIEIHQMGRSVGAGFIARSQQNGFKHGARRPFSISAPYRDLDIGPCHIQLVGNSTNAFQAKVYGCAMQRLKIAQRSEKSRVG